MRFKHKIGNICLTGSLILMVLVSLSLSAYIWGSDSRFSRIEQASNQSPAKKEVGQKSIREIYIPTQLFYYHNNQLYQVYGGKVNLPLQFSKITQPLEETAPVKMTSSKSAYDNLIKNQNYLQLTYPDQITISLFLTKLKRANNGEFNRLFVPINSSEKYLYLGNDQDYTVYRLAIGKINFEKFYNQIKNAKVQMPVALHRLSGAYLPFYEEETELPNYSYLTNQETDSYFVYRLLGTGSINQRNSSTSITYSNGVYERLIAAKNTHNYEYVNFNEGKIPGSVTKRLSTSLYYVRKIGLVDPDLHFFDGDNNNLIYQSFVEEYPVFLPGDYNTRAQVNFTKNRLRINFNSLNLQIPIPSNGSKSTLPATRVALNQLIANGYSKKSINRIIVGYTVNADSNKDSRLVDLVPTYYVKIKGRWRSLKEWINDSPISDPSAKAKLQNKEALENGL
ncbi:regulatory protein YycH of two-component signal transduction system YycFG [Lactobacillus colini]|uniref:Regulatory protein YycH of two-component signal transduction system YycFG n=1 Tax=Lactobacillus colini TaxID=1819254 RepID=A0ABS4MDS7_9LACO|nr:two-component system activity regulator YycH [Lactobacillus colini]MBP2057496.1 regulatory protein YycH of two-component signal transduction system YycFG [Lactobacillus colini]